MKSYTGYRYGKYGDVRVTSFVRFTWLTDPLVEHLANKWKIKTEEQSYLSEKKN